MKISFIRHAKLVKPFDNYSQLSLEQLNDLATGKIEPSIQLNQGNKILAALKRINAVRNNTIILHSLSLRSKQTAKELRNHLLLNGKKNISTQSLKELGEIQFNPKAIMKDSSSLDSTISDLLKKQIIEQLFANKNNKIESLKKIVCRIVAVEKKIHELSQNSNLIFVTHGYFLKFLQLYFLVGITDAEKLNQYQYQNTISFHCGNGFSIDVENGKNISAKNIKSRVAIFQKVRDVSYFVGDSQNDSSCITKHKVLSKLFFKEKLRTKFYECKFKWSSLGLPPDIINSIEKNHMSKHVYLKVFIPEVGKFQIVDATWNRNKNNKIKINEWTGFTNTRVAVPCISSRIIKNNRNKPVSYQEINKGNIPPQKKPLVDSINHFFNS